MLNQKMLKKSMGIQALKHKLSSSIQACWHRIKKQDWRKSLAGLVFFLVFLIVLAPEFAMFSFLLDAAVIDAIILFSGFQLARYWDYLRWAGVQTCLRIKVLFKWPRESE